MFRFLTAAFVTVACLAAFTPSAQASTHKKTDKKSASKAPPKKAAEKTAATSLSAEAAGVAEARLIEVYKLIGSGRHKEALDHALRLVRDYPNFQLAHLVYGDLLASRVRPVQVVGDVPDVPAGAAANTLSDLRLESARRIAALREPPPPGLVPSQFMALSTASRHAIAVDASKSRLYLFENSSAGLKLIGNYYISVGKAGTSKLVEGDQRTPLGVYYITSSLDPKSLKEFYGSGALPISYPNVLDSKRGKTGSGIWLHGTPPSQFSRAPQASDGCVVLANPDLLHIVNTVAVRSTPVVIAAQLQWVQPQKNRAEAKPFEDTLNAWRLAKSSGRTEQVLSFYTQDFSSNGKGLAQWTPTLQSEMQKFQGRTIELKDISMLRWTDSADTMVVTFGEVAKGVKWGLTKRQYWVRENNQWKIFFEGTM
ncbi:L,D-transpeptidase [Curvibacter sp. APW13]|uniref:L,D-transpeptidase family protein n=1 Tax=Curvibacter sp. APW13 TaxID=3077236 RepID=UPI0028E06F7D|nr:L,D-transpeptidase [Curvibacter sp. APW13]MDT8991423.1 L,D-transpeptidase [Curvibacter sp. APW13]